MRIDRTLRASNYLRHPVSLVRANLRPTGLFTLKPIRKLLSLDQFLSVLVMIYVI